MDAWPMTMILRRERRTLGTMFVLYFEIHSLS